MRTKKLFQSSLILFLILLAVGCAENPNKKFFDLASENLPGKFQEPITQDKYAYIVHGFFIHKKDTKIDAEANKITYHIIYDNRGLKAQYAKDYDITAPNVFRLRFPAFVKKTGWIKCGTKLGEETTSVLSEAMKEISKNKGQVGQESAALCLTYELTKSK